MQDARPIEDSTKTNPTSPSRKRGGPKTAKGKAASRRNALKHGLTAKTLLPEILQGGRVAALRKQLEHDLQGVMKNMMLDEIARHAAMLEVAAQAEEAVLRAAARFAAAPSGALGPSGSPTADSVLCAAVTTPALDVLTRHRRPHERALFSAWNMVVAMENGPSGVTPQAASPDSESPRFQSEAECEEYLQARFAPETWKCPGCSSEKGHWLAARKAWECGGCQKQVSIRSATLFERSPLSLVTWFYAVQLVIQIPGIGAPILAEKLGIARGKTVRAMAAKIRAALTSETSRAKFAGLDNLFRQPVRT